MGINPPEREAMGNDENEQSTAPIVLIVEDHEIVREGMRKVIAQAFGHEVEVVLAGTLAEAKRVTLLSAARIQLILLDLDLPDADATVCLRCVEDEWHGLPVAILSASEDWDVGVRFMGLGVLGFLQKRANIEMMRSALRLIVAGGRCFPDEILRRACTPEFSAVAPPTVIEPETAGSAAGIRNSTDRTIDSAPDAAIDPAVDPAAIEGLSPRKREVLRLMLDGRSNKEIARELGLSIGTTKNYVAAVMQAFGVSGRMNLMRAALTGTGAPQKRPRSAA